MFSALTFPMISKSKRIAITKQMFRKLWKMLLMRPDQMNDSLIDFRTSAALPEQYRQIREQPNMKTTQTEMAIMASIIVDVCEMNLRMLALCSMRGSLMNGYYSRRKFIVESMTFILMFNGAGIFRVLLGMPKSAG